MSGPPIFDEGGNPVSASSDASPAPASGDDCEPTFTPMSLDEARAAMVREHGVALGKDDPILMAVTLHQGFCADLGKLLQLHAKRIERMQEATVSVYAESVGQMLDSLKDKTVKASLDHAFGLVERQEQSMEQLRGMLKRHRRALAAFTGLTWGAAMLALLIVFAILR